MAILNCDTCGSVNYAEFNGEESLDTHAHTIANLDFVVRIDSQDNLSITPQDQAAWAKVNTTYWLQQLTTEITNRGLYLVCGCGDEIDYDPNITQAQQPGQHFQQPTNMSPPLNAILSGTAHITPPSGPLPSPPEVTKEEKKEEPVAHEPTTLRIELPDAVRKLIEDK